MKTFLIYISILFACTSTILAQSRYNPSYGSQQQTQGTQDKPKEITPEMMGGILIYNSDEVFKKVKIKDDATQQIVEKAVSQYNNKIIEIKAFSIEAFSKVKWIIDQKNADVQNSNIDDLMEARYKINDLLKPVQDKVDAQQAILNKSLEKDLTAKQYSKWLKYALSKIKELRPAYKIGNFTSENSTDN